MTNPAWGRRMCSPSHYMSPGEELPAPLNLRDAKDILGQCFARYGWMKTLLIYQHPSLHTVLGHTLRRWTPGA